MLEGLQGSTHVFVKVVSNRHDKLAVDLVRDSTHCLSCQNLSGGGWLIVAQAYE
jgi:hypothetical protein